MKKITIGNGAAIFILFFGISVLESVRQEDWRWLAGWCVLFIIFLIADNMKRNIRKGTD